MKYCPKCGIECPDDAMFCMNCGGSFVNTPNMPVGPEPIGSGPRRRGDHSGAKVVGASLATILALVAVLVGGFFAVKAFVPSVFGITFVNKAAFPDDAFRSFVAQQIDLDGNGIIMPSENAAVGVIDFADESSMVRPYEEKNWATASLEEQPIALGEHGDPRVSGILSLEGIEYFDSLKVLDCAGMGLTDLDLSGNSELEYVDCRSNALSQMDLAKNASITTLYCDESVTVNGLADAGLYFTEMPVESLQRQTSESGSADGEFTTSAEYDAFGRLRTRLESWSDADEPMAVEYRYDEAGRLAEVSNAWESETYSYDNGDRLVGYVVDGGEDLRYVFDFEYDEAGRLIGESSYCEAASSPSCSCTYSYDDSGVLASRESEMIYSAGSPADPRTQRYEFDESGRLVAVEDGEVRVAKGYGESGAYESETYTVGGDGDYIRVRTTEYDDRGFPVRTSIDFGEGGEAMIVDYGVNADGYVTSATYEATSGSTFAGETEYTVSYVKRIGSYDDRMRLRYVPTLGVMAQNYFHGNIMSPYVSAMASEILPMTFGVSREPNRQPLRELGLLDSQISNPNERLLASFDRALFAQMREA